MDRNNLNLLLPIALIGGVYLLINNAKELLGIKTDKEKEADIKKEIEQDSRSNVAVVKKVQGVIVPSTRAIINLGSVAEILYDKMGGNTFVGVDYQVYFPYGLSNTLKTIAPENMRQLAEIYATKYKRNLKSDLIKKMPLDEEKEVTKYLNAF
jgi:hypothetical protein